MTQDTWAAPETPRDGNSNRLEALGSAAAGIAHDINNELTLVLNYLSITDLEGARAAASRCTALTASLLSYCRGEDLDLRRIDPSAFLQEFAQTLTLPPAICLRLEFSEGLAPIVADSAALTRVLNNLVLNALHAMEDSGTITVRANGDAIQIEDSGPGIEPGLESKIFHPFFSTKGKRGTGLGLAIVREIMRGQGGSVGVLSGTGRGACFELRFRK